MVNKKYTMNISLNVLNHLGINLYSNTPSVIAEVIANAWDADATEVRVIFDKLGNSITISDNGCGMDEEDINEKYLLIGYRRRDGVDGLTPLKNRKPMGRKGIGKLSLFSIADRIYVYSKKNQNNSALVMDANAIKKIINQEGINAETKKYHPEVIDFHEDILRNTGGTVIKITELKKQLSQMTENGLIKRLARRFSVIGGAEDFKILVNGKQITYADRGYFHKARFLFQYGKEDFSVHCKKLDEYENGDPYSFSRSYKFDEEGNLDDAGCYEIKGWIGVAHHSNDLDGVGDDDDNLNSIVVVVRGKVAQEDVLHQFRKGGLITKFIYGEIQADFLDDDSETDIATSSRQKIMEDAPRYIALKKFIGKELDYIWKETNKLKAKKGVEKALKSHPKIQEWYNELKSPMKKQADTLFGTIEQINVDEKDKSTLYVSGILAFEKMKMDNTLDKLNQTEPGHLEAMLSVFGEVDDIEAAHYYEIVNGRLQVIEKLNNLNAINEKEKAIQKYIFEHLWLLDPAWERATSEAYMEKGIQSVIKNENKEVKNMRVDIQYKKVAGSHVIIELKRSSVKVKKTEIEEQIKKYIKATKEKLQQLGKHDELIEGICIVGKMPDGWDNNETRKNDIDSLKPHGIKVLTYDELIDNAYSAYSKFIVAHENVGRLRDLIREIRAIDQSE